MTPLLLHLLSEKYLCIPSHILYWGMQNHSSSLSQSLYLSLCLSFSVSLSFSLSVHLSVCLSPSLCLSLSLSISPPPPLFMCVCVRVLVGGWGELLGVTFSTEILMGLTYLFKIRFLGSTYLNIRVILFACDIFSRSSVGGMEYLSVICPIAQNKRDIAFLSNSFSVTALGNSDIGDKLLLFLILHFHINIPDDT